PLGAGPDLVLDPRLAAREVERAPPGPDRVPVQGARRADAGRGRGPVGREAGVLGPPGATHSSTTNDAIGPDAMSRNQRRAAPRSASAVTAPRKKPSMRASMKRALPARERRWRSRKSPRRAATSAGRWTQETRASGTSRP